MENQSKLFSTELTPFGTPKYPQRASDQFEIKESDFMDQKTKEREERNEAKKKEELKDEGKEAEEYERHLANELKKALKRNEEMRAKLEQVTKSIQELQKAEEARNGLNESFDSEGPTHKGPSNAELIGKMPESIQQQPEPQCEDPISFVRRLNMEKRKWQKKYQKEREKRMEDLLNRLGNFRSSAGQNINYEHQKHLHKVQEGIEFHEKMRAARERKMAKSKKAPMPIQVTKNLPPISDADKLSEQALAYEYQKQREDDIRETIAPVIEPKRYSSAWRTKVIQADRLKKNEMSLKDEETRYRKLRQQLYSQDVHDVFFPGPLDPHPLSKIKAPSGPVVAVVDPHDLGPNRKNWLPQMSDAITRSGRNGTQSMNRMAPEMDDDVYGSVKNLGRRKH